MKSKFLSLERAVEAALRHIAAVERAENIDFVIDVCTENHSGFSESVVRMLKGSNSVLDFDVEFQC